jgi:hypothetical protein
MRTGQIAGAFPMLAVLMVVLAAWLVVRGAAGVIPGTWLGEAERALVWLWTTGR